MIFWTVIWTKTDSLQLCRHFQFLFIGHKLCFLIHRVFIYCLSKHLIYIHLYYFSGNSNDTQFFSTYDRHLLFRLMNPLHTHGIYTIFSFINTLYLTCLTYSITPIEKNETNIYTVIIPKNFYGSYFLA